MPKLELHRPLLNILGLENNVQGLVFNHLDQFPNSCAKFASHINRACLEVLAWTHTGLLSALTEKYRARTLPLFAHGTESKPKLLKPALEPEFNTTWVCPLAWTYGFEQVFFHSVWTWMRPRLRARSYIFRNGLKIIRYHMQHSMKYSSEQIYTPWNIQLSNCPHALAIYNS